MTELVAAVAQLKASGARRSPQEVLTQLQQSGGDLSHTTLAQVRRAITAANKLASAVDVAAKAAERRKAKEKERVRTGRARPAEEQAKRARNEPQQAARSVAASQPEAVAAADDDDAWWCDLHLRGWLPQAFQRRARAKRTVPRVGMC